MDKKKTTASGERLYKVFIYVVLIALAVTIIVPVAWVFMASVKENSEFYGNPWTLPQGFYWQNFVDAWNSAKMGSYMINSVIVTALALGILLVVALPEDRIAHIAEQSYYAVQHSVFRLVNRGEDSGDYNHGKDIRNIEDHPEKILALQLFPRQNPREHQRKGEGDDRHHHDQKDHILHGADKACVSQKGLEIARSHKGLARRIGSLLIQGNPEHVKCGNNHE